MIQVLALRRYQLRHDGRLPVDLHDLVHTGELSELPIDPYSGQIFHYVPSQGQNLPPLGLTLQGHITGTYTTSGPTRGMRLLYSIGPNRFDSGAWTGSDDLVFALPDKPGAVPDPPPQPMPEGMDAMMGAAAGAADEPASLPIPEPVPPPR